MELEQPKHYIHDVFYKQEDVISRLDEFKEDVKKYLGTPLLEQKYKNGVNHRELTNKSLEWILNKCTKEDDIRIVHRMPNFNKEEYWQVVFVNDWYFAWFNGNIKHKEYFINKYDLKIRI